MVISNSLFIVYHQPNYHPYACVLKLTIEMAIFNHDLLKIEFLNAIECQKYFNSNANTGDVQKSHVTHK